MVPPLSPPVYRFGEYVLDAGRRVLLRAGDEVGLTPKEFQTLLLLVEAEGRAVGREELIKAIWPDSVVGDTSLGRNISVLRRYLGAEAIVSVARFGYRFTPEVRREAAAAVDGVRGTAQEMGAPAVAGRAVNGRRRPWRRPAGVLGVCTVLALVVLLVGHRWRVSAASATLQGEAAYWDGFGNDALHQGTFFKASKAFEHAERLAPQSGLVHLHRAQALFLMDFIEGAQKEMLLAEAASGRSQLTETDRLRAEALRAMIVQDYGTALEDYGQAAAQTAGTERAYLLEDLGLAYQRAGRMDEAAAKFAEAQTMMPANPGVELYLSKLDGLQRRWSGVTQHLDQAEQLFEAGSNLEGEAEVSYQHALTDYVQAQYKDAEAHLERSLEIADQLKDEDLAMRTMGALSTMYRWDGRLDLSQKYALQVTEAAVQSGSTYFYTAGVQAQANVAVARHDEAASERLLQQAAELSVRTGNARQEANAEYAFADFSGDRGDYANEVAYANRAREHYRSYGSVDGVADAELMRIDGETKMGQLAQALKDAQALLATSEQTHSDLFAEDTEVQLGLIYSAMNNEPEALVHFLRAQAWSRKTGSQPELKAVHVAGSYARLGRWKEARAAWDKVPVSTGKDPDSAKAYAEVAALMKGLHKR
jgi:DNA-binding winged helix-turn-helix (wHTH) protein/tetratricopeptide (TPR) repeat protein